MKHITQDDAHIFCAPEQIEDEIFGCLDYASYLYDLFEMEARFELSTRPEKKLGTDEEWDFTEGALRAALEKRGIEYVVNEGDGAFYGPKIDLHMTDALGRSWQMGTIQLDAQMPQNFGLTYMGADNTEHTPYVVHRALLGSLERFMGILIEHYAGAFPFWLAPVQVRVLPVGDAHVEAASALVSRLRDAGYRAEVGAPSETIGKRIRATEMEKSPGRDRLRRQGERREPRRARARWRTIDAFVSRAARAACYPLASEKQGRTRSSPSGPRAFEHGGAGRFNRVRTDEDTGRCMTAAFHCP